MAEKKEWEERYDAMKNSTPEQLEAEYQNKDTELARKLAQIKDTNSKEYKELKTEKSKLKEENDILKEKSKQIYKNFPLIDKTRENRDEYQKLLDELTEKKDSNNKIIEKRRELGEEAKKLEEELKDLQEMEGYSLNAINNPSATEEQKARARQTLQDTRDKMNQNQQSFSANQKALQGWANMPLNDLKEEQIEEYKNKIDRCNKICELLLDGKNMGEVQTELGKVNAKTRENESTEPTAPEKTEPTTEPEKTEPTTEPEKAEQPTEPKKTEPTTEPGKTEPKVEQEKIEEMQIRTDANGTTANIQRGKGTNSKTDWGRRTRLTDKVENVTNGQLKEAYNKAIELGDKFVAREILKAVYDKRITIDEAKEQLTTYTDILNEDKDPADKDNRLSISYDLRGLRKAGLEDDERKKLIANAKKAKDIGLVDKENIKAPLYIKAMWKAQDIGNWFKQKGKGVKALIESRKTERLGAGKPTEENTHSEGEKVKPGELSTEDKKLQQKKTRELADKVSKDIAEGFKKAKEESEKKRANIEKMTKDPNKTEER